MIPLPAAPVLGAGADSITPDTGTVLHYQLERHRGHKNRSDPCGNSCKSSDHSSSITSRCPVTRSHSKWPRALLLPSWKDLQIPHKLTCKHQLGRSDKCRVITAVTGPSGLRTRQGTGCQTRSTGSHGGSRSAGTDHRSPCVPPGGDVPQTSHPR